MTIAERNNKLKHLITCMKCEVSGKVCDDNCPTQYNAGNMGEIIENLEAISRLLEQDPFINKPCVSSGVCEHDKNVVLGKIRAEIEDLDVFYDNDYFSSNKDAMFKCADVLQIIDKYKAESENKE